MKLNTQPNITKTISSYLDVDLQLVLTGKIPPFSKGAPQTRLCI